MLIQGSEAQALFCESKLREGLSVMIDVSRKAHKPHQSREEPGLRRGPMVLLSPLTIKTPRAIAAAAMQGQLNSEGKVGATFGWMRDNLGNTSNQAGVLTSSSERRDHGQYEGLN